MTRLSSLFRNGVAAAPGVVLGFALLVSASPGTAAAASSAQWVMGYYVGYLEGDLPPAKIA